MSRKQIEGFFKPELIVFDFDGVILESADIKTEAFRKLFMNYPEQVDEIVSHHKKNAGVSRYEKFRYIYQNILKEPLSEKDMRVLGERFSELAVDEIKKCPMVPGAIDFLESYSEKIKLFIASSSPELELRSIAEFRNVNKYFRGIYGAPMKKSEITIEIMGKENVHKSHVIFVGDTMADYEESRKSGVNFIGRVPDPLNSPFPKGTKIVADLAELAIVVDQE